MGRVLRKQIEEGWLNRCAECGATHAGKVETLCACGTKLKTGFNAGLRCQINPEGPTAENPAEIIVMFVGIETKEIKHTQIKFKEIREDDLFR